MLQSKLFGKTIREAPKDEVAVNAKLLIRAGFIDKLLAGVYQFLPLGLRVLNKIENIIREEMNALGAQEVLMPALHPKENWERTGRWDVEAHFKALSRFGEVQFALAPTHEEAVVPLVSRTTLSYKELPFGLYQIQTKFRDEPRAKSGLLRGREFRMKDLYSFHANGEDLGQYHEVVAQSYERIFKRLGLRAMRVKAGGGTFSEFSDEFQALNDAGEDIVFHCSCGFAQNREIIAEDLKDARAGTKVLCPECGKNELQVSRAAEVGNIFKLGTRYTEPFGLTFTDADSSQKPILMGCYGLGSSRVMGTIVEVSHDANGIIWPDSIAPFQVHLIELANESRDVHAEAQRAHNALQEQKIEVLYDDRADASAGEKFADADLIGIPWRVVVSERSVAQKGMDAKRRNEQEGQLMKLEDTIEMMKKI